MNRQAQFLAGNLKQQESHTTDAKNIALQSSVGKLIDNHLSSFLNNDLETLMTDYTEESVLITHIATYLGIEQIRAFFEALLKDFPKNKFSFTMERSVVQGDLAYIVWQAQTPTLTVPLGSDTFIIKNGKISQQTFVGQLIEK